MRGIGGRRRDELVGLDRLAEHPRQRSGRPLLLLEELGDIARDAAEDARDRQAEQRREASLLLQSSALAFGELRIDQDELGADRLGLQPARN